MAIPMDERDQYIIAQGLYLGKKALEAVPLPYREVSNIADMDRLLDTMFPHYKAIFEAQEAAKNHHFTAVDVASKGDAS